MSNARQQVEIIKKQLMEYVSDRVIDSRVDVQRTLYCVCWYSYGPEGDISEPAEHLPRQFIARYEQTLGQARPEKQAMKNVPSNSIGIRIRDEVRA